MLHAHSLYGLPKQLVQVNIHYLLQHMLKKNVKRSALALLARAAAIGSLLGETTMCHLRIRNYLLSNQNSTSKRNFAPYPGTCRRMRYNCMNVAYF